MRTLFPLEPGFPNGFRYVPDFISTDQEKVLLAEISKIELHTFRFQGYEAKRKVSSFGFDYSFDRRVLSKGTEIPIAFMPTIERVAAQTGVASQAFAEMLITEYPPGSVINWHRDAPPFEIIAGISLRSDCTFRLRPHEKARQNRKAIISFPVRCRSLYVIRDEARIDWEHSTRPVNEVRYSITLRTLRP